MTIASKTLEDLGWPTYVDHWVKGCATARGQAAVRGFAMFDVDHFKKVNDTHGHLAGDAVLKDLAARIQPRIRREDLFARYGGEEFACVLPSTALPGGIVFAEHLRTIIEEKPVQFEDKAIGFTISLGVTTMHREVGVDTATLIKRADENLYAAKRGGRNRVVPCLADLIPG